MGNHDYLKMSLMLHGSHLIYIHEGLHRSNKWRYYRTFFMQKDILCKISRPKLCMYMVCTTTCPSGYWLCSKGLLQLVSETMACVTNVNPFVSSKPEISNLKQKCWNIRNFFLVIIFTDPAKAASVDWTPCPVKAARTHHRSQRDSVRDCCSL